MNNKHLINLVENTTELAKQNTNLYGILVDTIVELSVIYPKHEIETIPVKVRELVQRLIKAEGIDALAQKRRDEPAWKSWNWPRYTPATPRSTE